MGLKTTLTHYLVGGGFEAERKLLNAEYEEHFESTRLINGRKRELEKTLEDTKRWRIVPNVGLALTAVTSLATGEMQYEMLIFGEAYRFLLIGMEQYTFSMLHKEITLRKSLVKAAHQAGVDLDSILAD